MTKLVSIPFNFAFLDTIAQKWMEEFNDQGIFSSGMIILPNQRAVKALLNSFIKINGGKPLLLPHVLSVGAVDETGMVLSGKSQLTLFPAVHKMKRLSILTNLIMQMNQYSGNQMQAGEAWKMAGSLADLMDEAEWAGCDLYENLPKAVEGEYAQHWQDILRFLSIITEIWPQWLIDNQMMNPVARSIAVLKAQFQIWENSRDIFPIWLVGFADARPAIVDFLSTVVQLPGGRLILAGLQHDLSEESWNSLPFTHPYAETAKMLSALGMKRSDFEKWDLVDFQRVTEERVSIFHQVLLPAENLEQWRLNRYPVSLSDCFLIEPINQQQEALAIALIIRDALETPCKRIALVTPDRELAMRVSMELGRWGVIADDSAGEPLCKTTGAVLMNLVLQACIEDFTPISLLSLLKHPLVCCGMSARLCRECCRLLEIHVLRQFAASGLSTIKAALLKRVDEISLLDKAGLTMDLARFLSFKDMLVGFLDTLQAVVSPLFGSVSKKPLGQWVSDLVQVAECLVSNSESSSDEAVLWQAEEGNALAEHLRSLIVETDFIRVISLQEFFSILETSYQGLMVRGRRALRGRKEQELHPRVYIWGLLEARLQNVDMVVLGGLSEGVWPAFVDSGPWLGRPMREKMGMRVADIEVGQSAYDFMAICCSIPQIVLSSPLRRDNAPVVQSRWIVRLKAWLRGRNSHIQSHSAMEWVKLLDQPERNSRPVDCPRPNPPLSQRPRSISITDVERWMKNPYEIYAKKILHLDKITGIEEDRSSIVFGMIVHEGLRYAYESYALHWNLEKVQEALLRELDSRQDVLVSYKKWWRNRLLRIAEWVFSHEQEHRQARELPKLYLEKKGQHRFRLRDGLEFTLNGRADRIGLNLDGTVEVFDYKTGKLPSVTDVKAGLFPQLPLEAAMIACGGFGRELMGNDVLNLYYWQLKGDMEQGKVVAIGNKPKHDGDCVLSERYWQVLQELIIAYQDETQPYLFYPRPSIIREYSQRLPVFGDYRHLARFLEWSMAQENT